MMKANCLLFFGIFLLALSCTSPDRQAEQLLAEDTLAAADISRQLLILSDSLTTLQDEIRRIEVLERQNDSLQQLATRRQSVQTPVDQNQASPASSTETAALRSQLEQLRLSLKRAQQKNDSLAADNQQLNSQLRPLKESASRVRLAQREKDSLQALNKSLADRLLKIQQRLSNLQQQKTRDSLAFSASSGSAARQQQQVNLLVRQKDSLARQNVQLTRQIADYDKSLNQLRAQYKKDSAARQIAPVKEMAQPEQQTVSSNEERYQKELDSLSNQIRMLSEQLASIESNANPTTASPEASTRPDSASSIRRWTTEVKPMAVNKDLREGFRLLLLAQQEEKRDPTLSLKLLREALRYSDDSLIIRETKRVYESYYFYETLVEKRRPARSISLNEQFLAVNLANDSAYLYSGLDSLLKPAQAFSRVSAILLPPQAFLFTGHPTGHVSLYNLSTGKQQNRFEAHDKRITALGFIGRNESFLATGASDKVVNLWTNKFEKTYRLVGLRSAVIFIDASRSQLIAAAAGDMSPRLWNTEGKLLLNLGEHRDSVYSMDISDNARFLLTAGRDGIARIWDLKGEYVRSLPVQKAPLTQGIFSHSQRMIALASADGNISLWNFNGVALGKLAGHSKQVNQLVFDKGDTYLYSCSDDGSVRRWLIKKPKEVDLSIVPPLTDKERVGLSVLK